MSRSFIIFHISDLHLDGAQTHGSALGTLISTIDERMQDFIRVQDRILLITGDLVDDPNPRAFSEAKNMINRFTQTRKFTNICAVAGNHDVRSRGLFRKADSAYDRLSLPKDSESKFFPNSRLDLILLDSNGASFANFAKGKIVQKTYDSMSKKASELAGKLKEKAEARQSEGGALVRILALHHHPLPQARGERSRVFGIRDEPLMYLASPATFLQAAMSIDTDLILHGHRHVRGLARYSIPDDAVPNKWRELYVLGCPSSTGHGGDDAGFNIIHCEPRSDIRRLRIEFEVNRLTRENNVGAFTETPGKSILSVIRPNPELPVLAEIEESKAINRAQVVAFARKLVAHEAFTKEPEQRWSHTLYIYFIIYRGFEQLSDKFGAGFDRDRNILTKILKLLNDLISLYGRALGVSSPDIDGLRAGDFDRQRIVEQLPSCPVSSDRLDSIQRTKVAIVDEILGTLTELGVDVRK
jgi:Icc protein